MEQLLEKLQALKNAVDERNETINKHLAATLGELKSMAELVRDTKTMVDIDSSHERESQEIAESHTVTTCVPQSEVPTSVLEHSHRFFSRSLEVCENPRYLIALVGKDHVLCQSGFGKDSACKVLDRMLQRKYRLQEKRKMSLSCKSWKFKYKETKFLGLHAMSQVYSGFVQIARIAGIELEMYGWESKRQINPVADGVEVATIDSFQGLEADAVIISILNETVCINSASFLCTSIGCISRKISGCISMSAVSDSPMSSSWRWSNGSRRRSR